MKCPDVTINIRWTDHVKINDAKMSNASAGQGLHAVASHGAKANDCNRGFVKSLKAFFANQNSLDHPESDLQVNGLGTLRLLEYSALTGVKRFVYASSGCSIYGSHAPMPLKEDFMSLHLSTPYQITKMLGELYCNFFQHQYEVPVVKARFFNSYGPGEIPGQYRNVIPNFTYWAMSGKALPITGTGEETIFSIISRIASISPPGVLRRTRSSDAFSFLACAMALPTISAVMGCTIPSTSTATTFGAANAACASSASANAGIPLFRNLT